MTVPSTLFWTLEFLAAALHNPQIASPATTVVNAAHIWFIVPVLLVMPFIGGTLAALGFRRARVLAIIAMLLGFGAAGLNILMQTAP